MQHVPKYNFNSSTALTELNAFVDILAVIKEGRYLSVYPVASEQPEPNMSLVLAGKKRVR